MKSIDVKQLLIENNYKVEKGTSFREFYYIALYIDNSKDFYKYIITNNWYFERMENRVKEQFRRLYRLMAKEENDSVNNNFKEVEYE